jgi:hypothetical protein
MGETACLSHAPGRLVAYPTKKGRIAQQLHAAQDICVRCGRATGQAEGAGSHKAALAVPAKVKHLGFEFIAQHVKLSA